MDIGMKLSVIEIKTITASEGMVLTNGETFSDVSGTVYLGKNDVPDNWHEITAEEAERLQEIQETSVYEE